MASKYEWTCPKCSQTFTGDDSDALEDRAWDHLERVHKDDSVLVKIKRSAVDGDRRAADSAGDYAVTWTDRNYKDQRKVFKNDHQGPAGNAEAKARAFAKKLEDGDAKAKYGDIRGKVTVKAEDSRRRAAAHRALDAILEERANAWDMEPGNEAIKRAAPDLRREILAAEKRLAVAVSSADAKRLEALLDKLWAKVPAKDARLLGKPPVNRAVISDAPNTEVSWTTPGFASKVRKFATEAEAAAFAKELSDPKKARVVHLGDKVVYSKFKAVDMRTRPSNVTNACPYCDADHDPAIQCRLMPVSPRGWLGPRRPAKDDVDSYSKVLFQIQHLQEVQARNKPGTPAWERASKKLAPLFRRMAEITGSVNSHGEVTKDAKDAWRAMSVFKVGQRVKVVYGGAVGQIGVVVEAKRVAPNNPQGALAKVKLDTGDVQYFSDDQLRPV